MSNEVANAVIVKALKTKGSGDKGHPRTTVTVKCKDNLRIAVKPKSINAWLWN